MLRAIKIRLYPNKEQSIQYNKLIGCYRFVYNQCLNRKIESYKNDGITENLSTLGQFIHHELLKDDNFIWLREQNTKVLKQAVKDMLAAYKNFFEQLDGDLTHQVKETNNNIGIDLGVKDFVITSEGEVFNNLYFKKLEIKKIKKLQKQLSRKQKGSNNRNKARIKLAKVYKKIDDKKRYYLHSVSNSLIDENQVICMEDLNVKGMTKNHNLAESILEMNFGEFRRMLEYKDSWYNRKIVFVGRFYPSSKTCHNCGYVNKELTLNDREWLCPHCGEVISRDYNAALNILDEEIRIIGCSSPESKLAENPTMDDPIRNDLLKSSGSVKQEVNKARSSTLCKF